jgi:hypothetical protein
MSAFEIVSVGEQETQTGISGHSTSENPPTSVTGIEQKFVVCSMRAGCRVAAG